MRVFTAEYLRGIASELLEAAGTSPTNARLIGDSLIDANLAGHDSHGILRLPAYLQAVAIRSSASASESWMRCERRLASRASTMPGRM